MLVISIAGCTDDKPVPMQLTDRGIERAADREGYVPTWSHPNPLEYSPSPGIGENGQEIVKHDPLLRDTPKPFDVVDNKTLEDPNADPVVDLADPLVNTARPKNWYWIRGRIRSGLVEVKVNSHFIGRFSVHVDREITDNLRRGYNTIEFTPVPNIRGAEVGARLEVVYSQQDPGAAPVLIYDSSRLDASRPNRLPSHAPQIGGPTFAANPGESSALNAIPDLGPRTTTMKLVAR
jgi:hypothetical protein